MSPVIPQERPLIDRMREAVPELEWRMSGKIATGRDAGRDVVSANQRGHLLCWVNAKDEPHAVDIQYPGDTEAVRIVREWWAKAKSLYAPQRTAIERFREAIPELEWVYSVDGDPAIYGRSPGLNEIRWTPSTHYLQCGEWSSKGASYTTTASVDDAVKRAREWYDATHPKPVPATELTEALTTAGWTCHTDGYKVHASREIAGVRQWFESVHTDGGWTFPDSPHVWTQGALLAEIAERFPIAPSPPSRTDALVEAIRAACPKVNVYAENGAVRVHWDRMGWRFVRDGEHWRSGDTHCTQRGAVHEIRRYIDTHTLAEDQSLKGLTQQSRCTAWSGERTVTAEETTTLRREHAAQGAPSMDTKTLTQTIKVDASEAAWRTAGSQFVKLAREPLVGLLTRHLAPGDDAFRARLAAFLETELGTALLASMLSASLSALPQTAGDVPQKLARELRVRAMADAGDVLADVLMGPLRQVMALYLQDPQGAPQLGVATATAAEWTKAEQKEGVR